MYLETDHGRFWTPAETAEEVGRMSQAKLVASLVPAHIHEKEVFISDLKKEIVEFEVPTSEDLIEIGKEHSLEWKEYLEKKQLLGDAENELNNLLQGDGNNL